MNDIAASDIPKRCEELKEEIRVASDSIRAGRQVDLSPIEGMVRGVCDAAMSQNAETPAEREAADRNVKAVEELIRDLDALEQALDAHRP